MSLQNKLSDLEDEISNSSIKYNKDVLKYKNEIEKVPSNIIANIFKFKPELFFEIDKEEKEKKSKSPGSADYLYICCIIFGIDRLYCTFCCGR